MNNSIGSFINRFHIQFLIYFNDTISYKLIQEKNSHQGGEEDHGHLAQLGNNNNNNLFKLPMSYILFMVSVLFFCFPRKISASSVGREESSLFLFSSVF